MSRLFLMEDSLLNSSEAIANLLLFSQWRDYKFELSYVGA